jgi:hypothetical protein
MAEIKKLLKRYNLVRFHESYDDGELSGCIFTVRLDGIEVPFNLPINWYPLWEMAKRGETNYIKTVEQAQRVAWRQILRWVESQFALIDIGMAEFQEVFLPYVMIDKERTLYDQLRESNFKLLETNAGI